MANYVKYSTNAQTNALKMGNFWLGPVNDGKGPTSSTGYYTALNPPSGGFTIYLNKASNGPSIYQASNESQLVSITNQIGGTSFTTSAQCLTWYVTQTDKFCVNREYEGIVTNGLTFLVDPGFTPSYPRSGTTLYDLNGTNNPTLVNGVAYSSDNGGTFLYDGTDDFIQIAANNNLQPANSITLEVWFKSLGSNGRTQGLLYPNYGIGLRLQNTGALNARVNSMGSLQFFTTSTTYFNSQWNMASMTLSTAGTISLYVNGSFVQQNSVSYDGNSPFNTSDGGIGTDINDGANRGINGYIGPCKVYNRVLSSAEILQNYKAQKGRFGL